MSEQRGADFDEAMQLPLDERVGVLTRIGQDLCSNGLEVAPHRESLARALAALIEEGVGTARERVAMGEVLGHLGDPRLLGPEDEAYWAEVELPKLGSRITIGRYPVTNLEFRQFVDAGAYEDRSFWTDLGWEWVQGTEDPWPVRADESSSAPFVISNQPVVGVTWFEARAYAAWRGARLPRFDERLWVMRGVGKRPYPWGSPFGFGNANTREEVIGRPCAVGLFVRDSTPEGVRDLAGNVAEWVDDEIGGQRWLHPGAWDQPSMAAWAKARFLASPDSRWAALGFRIARRDG